MTYNDNIEFKRISSKEIQTIRHLVLRKDQPFKESIYPFDDDKDAVHFGACVDKQAVGAISFFKESSEKFSEEQQWRMRGLAVLPDYQGRGIASNVVRNGLHYLKPESGTIIWGNLRETSFNIFKRLEFNPVGEPYYTQRPGLHNNMIQLQLWLFYKKM